MDRPTKVFGLMFTSDKQYMLLIRDNKPEDKNILLYGIGGEVDEEECETPIQTMVRAFKEQTGVEIVFDDWKEVCMIDYQGSMHIFYKAFSDKAYKAKVVDALKQDLLMFSTLKALTNPTINLSFNLYWLIPLALDEEICGATALSNKTK